MRVLFTLLPAHGSLHPLVPLAHALVGAGHEVRFACAPSFRPEVERHGFNSLPVGLDFLLSRADYFPRLVADAAVEVPPLSGYERMAWVTNNLFIGAAARRMLPDLLALADSWRPNLIVRESTEYSGCVAAEKLGLPHASVAAPADGALDRSETTWEALETLRADAGLQPDPGARMAYRHLHLCFSPPSFDGPGARFPATARFLRHVDATPPGSGCPPWFEQLPVRPTVLVSLGTVFFRTPGLYEAVVAGMRDEPVNLVIALGLDQDPGRLGPQPVNVRVEPYLPIPAILPRCALFVTHGGFNSVKEALSAGIPMLVIPIASDQHYSAERCEALGVGRVVRADERTPEKVREAASAVLTDSLYRKNAQAVARVMARLPALEHAVELLEGLVVNSQAAMLRPYVGGLKP